MRRAEAIRRTAARLLVAGLLAAGAGCGEDRPECDGPDLGAVSWVLSPGLGGSPNLLDGELTFTAVLEQISEFETAPPTIRYRFRDTTSGGTRTLDLRDVGYRLPVSVDSTYTVTAENYARSGTVLRGYGLVVSDGEGVLALVASDYVPRPADDSLVFQDGYADLGLTVLFEDAGCEARVENSVEYLSITNRRLSFRIGGASVGLYHGGTGRLGPWTIRVFRAQAEVLKNILLLDNQTSFAMERTGG